MASQLASLARDWQQIELQTFNTAYADKRDDLGGGGISKILRFLRFKKEIIQQIHREGITTVILTPAFFLGPFIKDALMIRALKKHTKVKIIAWVHMDPARLALESRPALFQRFADESLKLVDLWVACAPSLLASWPTWIPGEKIAIPNAIPDPLDGADPVPRQSDGRFKVGYLSAMDPEKGWKDLFQAAQSLCAINETIEFHFYGGVGQRETAASLQQAFSESGFPERIQWHGKVEGAEKAKAFQSMDLFVFPSHTEQFPVTILEAMAHGLPIISTDVGAVKDALPEQTLIGARQLKKLETHIADLAQQVQQRKQMAANNRERFINTFRNDVSSEQWRNTIQSTE